VELAPGLQITVETALQVLGRSVAARLSAGRTELGLADIAASEGWTEATVALVADTPVATDILPQLKAREPREALLDEAASHPDEATRLWCADLLGQIGVGDAALPEDADSVVAQAFVVSALDAGKPRRAFDGFGRLQLVAGRDASYTETLNALGMGLVRGGYTEEAIEAFTALVEAYPGSQLAAHAEEHIQHLNATRVSQAR
jgi:hypothetical protein